jgi:hypothetical protein
MQYGPSGCISTLLQKLFFLALCVLAIYSLVSAAVTMARLPTINTKVIQQKEILFPFNGPWRHFANGSPMQQFTGAALYLFGLVLFLGLQRAYFTIDNSSTPGGWLILENFVIYFAFAANVFFVFLILHFVQWFISTRVDAYMPHS